MNKTQLHLDARTKICLSIIAMALSFCVHTGWQVLFWTVFLAVGFWVVRISVHSLWQAAKPLLLFLTLIAICNLLVTQQGAVLFAAGPLVITTGGLITAGLYLYRFLCILAAGAFLVLTTSPTDLTFGFERLLSPLSKLGVPVSEAALIMSLALRFIPTLSQEAQEIMEAQIARGAELNPNSTISRMRAGIANIVPMFVGAIRHANALSRALDARGYRSAKLRTHWKKTSFTTEDLLVCLIFGIGCGVLFWLGAL